MSNYYKETTTSLLNQPLLHVCVLLIGMNPATIELNDLSKTGSVVIQQKIITKIH